METDKNWKVIREKIVPSLISILRDNWVLDEDYSKRAKELYEKYHRFEVDPNISYEEKFKAMESWWKEHFDLLKEKWLTLNHIKEAVYHPDIQIREKFDEFLKILRERNIPLIIFSSSGLGVQSIKLVFEKFGLSLDNVIIISNELKFDRHWRFVGVDNILHSMNKKLKDHLDRIWDIIFWKNNALVLGDNLHDAEMVEWIWFEKIFRVWFFLPKLNSREEIEAWEQRYDLILSADASFEEIVKLVE